MVGGSGALIANFATGFIKIHNWIICRETTVRGLCSLSPLTHHPAAKPGPRLVSHQGTTAANECAVYVVAGDQQTVPPCSGDASPWASTRTGSANTGDVAGLQHETSVQRRFCLFQAWDAGSIFCSHLITSHTHHDRFKNQTPKFLCVLAEGVFLPFVVLASQIDKYFIQNTKRNGTSMWEEYLLGLQAKADAEAHI